MNMRLSTCVVPSVGQWIIFLFIVLHYWHHRHIHRTLGFVLTGPITGRRSTPQHQQHQQQQQKSRPSPPCVALPPPERNLIEAAALAAAAVAAASANGSEEPPSQPEGGTSENATTTTAATAEAAIEIDLDDLWDAAVDTTMMIPQRQEQPQLEDGSPIDDVRKDAEDSSLYRSRLLASSDKYLAFMDALRERRRSHDDPSTTSDLIVDPFWEQIKLEAETALEQEFQAGPQLYAGILSQPTLMSAICTVVSHEIETELIPATALKNVFMELLNEEDEYCIRQDLQAVATRSPSVEHAMDAILFHNGFHALVCYRVGHRLWQANRTGLAYYMQSTVSRTYSADIHPACVMGSGIYLRVGAGVVIGETAVVGNDVSVLEGVTLGGTGKEAGNRHPKIADGVILQDGGTVLGNIPVGEGSIVTAKSIVTKPVPPLAIVAGVPAKIQSYRTLQESEFEDDLHKPLVVNYLEKWKAMADELYNSNTTT